MDWATYDIICMSTLLPSWSDCQDVSDSTTYHHQYEWRRSEEERSNGLCQEGELIMTLIHASTVYACRCSQCLVNGMSCSQQPRLTKQVLFCLIMCMLLCVSSFYTHADQWMEGRSDWWAEWTVVTHTHFIAVFPYTYVVCSLYNIHAVYTIMAIVIISVCLCTCSVESNRATSKRFKW